MKKYIIAIIFIGLGLTLSASFFHADSNPLELYNGKTIEQLKQEGLYYGRGEGVILIGSASGYSGWEKEIKWNIPLFIRDGVIGISIILISCGMLILYYHNKK